jgi:hypothetical protein
MANRLPDGWNCRLSIADRRLPTDDIQNSKFETRNSKLAKDAAAQAAEKPVDAVILRSRRRRRISWGHENAQSEILRFAQNDSFEEFFRSLCNLVDPSFDFRFSSVEF